MIEGRRVFGGEIDINEKGGLVKVRIPRITAYSR
jgi:hypothetical protein